MSQGRLEEAEQNYQILVNASLLQLDRWSNSLKEADKIMKSVDKTSDEWLTQKEREDNVHEAIQDLTQTLATIYHDLGRTQESLNKTLESQSSYNMALELLERIASTDKELLSTIRTNLSMLYENLGNYKVAGPHHEQVLRQTTEIERYDHPHMMTSLHPCHLVSTDFSEQKKREDALDQSSPGWREQEMQWDPNDQRTNDEKAEELTQRTLTERLLKNPAYVAYKQEKGEPLPVLPSKSNYTSTVPSLLPSASGIAPLSASPIDGAEPNTLVDMSQSASQFASLFPSGENEDGPGGLLAEMTAEKGIDMIQAQTRKELSTVHHMLDGHIANLGESHMALVPIYSHLAVLSRRAGEFGPSLEYLNRALSIVKLHKGVRHCAYATMLMHIAVHHHAAQDLILAEVNAKQALHLKEELLGSDHLHVGLIHYDLAIILGKRSLFKESLQAIQEAVAIFTKKLYVDHSITQIAKMTLSRGESLVREQSIEDSHKALKGFKPE
jgi:tetratricopeptide (TPR) repeat protein